jgi:hypothetical protein
MLIEFNSIQKCLVYEVDLLLIILIAFLLSAIIAIASVTEIFSTDTCVDTRW